MGLHLGLGSEGWALEGSPTRTLWGVPPQSQLALQPRGDMSPAWLLGLLGRPGFAFKAVALSQCTLGRGRRVPGDPHCHQAARCPPPPPLGLSDSCSRPARSFPSDDTLRSSSRCRWWGFSVSPAFRPQRPPRRSCPLLSAFSPRLSQSHSWAGSGLGQVGAPGQGPFPGAGAGRRWKE